MFEIRFEVPGEPVGKGRPRAFRRGKGIAMHTPEKTASYEGLVALAANQGMAGKAPIDGPVSVGLSLFVVPPASWSKRKQAQALAGEIFPTSKPDIDNVTKAIFDACNEIVWKDDKQVVDLWVTKHYAERARAVVCVTPKQRGL